MWLFRLFMSRSISALPNKSISEDPATKGSSQQTPVKSRYLTTNPPVVSQPPAGKVSDRQVYQWNWDGDHIISANCRDDLITLRWIISRKDPPLHRGVGRVGDQREHDRRTGLIRTSKHVRILRLKDRRNTSPSRISLHIAAGTAGQGRIVQKDFINIGRAGCREESGPTSKIIVSEPKVGCVQGLIKDKIRAINRTMELIWNADDGDWLVHHTDRCRILVVRKNVLVDYDRQHSVQPSLLTEASLDVLVSLNSRLLARTL